MKIIRRLVVALVLLLGCSVFAAAQTTLPNESKLTSAKPATTDARNGNAPQVAAKADREEFVIGTGDVLAINVWKEAEVSRVVPVRSDGRISLPLVGEVQASGRTPRQLESELSAKLKDYVSEPEVTVIVQEIKSQKFNVLGMVMKPGSYALTNPMTVLDAIAMAGGFRDFAKQKDVYVLRRPEHGDQVRLPFNYKDVVKGHNSTQNVTLQPNDTIVVP